MNKLIQNTQGKTIHLALLAVVAIISLAFPLSSYAYDACIRLSIVNDDNACTVSEIAIWDDGKAPSGARSGPQYPNNNTSACPAKGIWIATGAPSSEGGRFFTKAYCGTGDRYRLKSVTDDGSGWLHTNLRAYAPSASATDFRSQGYWKSNHIEAPNSGCCGAPSTEWATLTYQQRSKYTVSYDFDDGHTRASSTTGWIDIGTTITKSAPSIAGYICVGWQGTGTFATPGSACSVSKTLLSDKTTANEITWNYKKASYLTTKVKSSGPGSSALIAPYTNSVRTLRANGNVTVQAEANVTVDGTNRWHLTGSTATGNLGDDTSGATSRNFTLNKETVVTWQYQKQASLTVGFEAGVPQSVRDGAAPFPVPDKTWHPINAPLNVTIASAVIDPGTGDQWLCTGWTGTGSVTASGSDCAAVPQFLLSGQSTITWNYGRVHRIRIDLEGMDLTPAAGDHVPQAGSRFFPLNSEQTISAKNVIYSTDQRTRYVLERWVGSGNIPLSGIATSGVARTEIGPFILNQNSIVRWVYRKEFGVKVNSIGLVVPGQADPVECVTANYTNCIDNAETLPRPGWVSPSDSSYPVNYYPVGTQLTVTTKHQVSDNGGIVTARGLNTLFGSLTDSSGLQLYNDRKAEAFTLSSPVELQWDYSDTTRFTVGEAITKPAGATDDKPKIEIILPAGVTADEAFFWSQHENKLYPLQAISSVKLTWTGVALPQEALVVWPSAQQQHIAQTPANISPDSTTLDFDSIVFAQNDAVEANGIFNANTVGKSVLLFFDGSINPLTPTPKIIVVNTVNWDDSSVPTVVQQCTVGTTIEEEAIHSDPEGRNGYLFNELAFYDGAGSNKAYDRTTRLGPIIPVNTVDRSDKQRHMLVIWYSTDSNNIGWPTTPYTYDCQWPAAPEEIVIASGKGWPAPTENYFPSGRIYYQQDPSLPGYNPNEEHGLFIANAVYALRNDFNAFSNASLPYVLLKYRNVSGDWQIQVFSIVKTTSTSTFTTESVDAGQPIQPFPPLNTLPPTDLSVLKIGNRWYHRDHKNGHWAKAADRSGGSEVVMDWYYPLQDGFYYPDFNGDDAPDKRTGDAIPFLGHDGGGSTAAVAPQEVRYPIVWPSDAPDLRLGETLVTGQPGLPDILNMASTRVLFDESLYDGNGHLVKLFDPISERRVALANLPEGLDTQSQDGKVYFKEAPYYLGSRFFYDPVAQELVFKGSLDTSGVGAPLLLPNIMSQAEKDVLIAKFGSLSLPIGQLFDKSRNPNGVNFNPAVPLINPFNSSLTHTASDWNDKIWGLPLGIEQDQDGNPQSVTLLGVKNALTAGTAAGTGYVTLIENDHEDLGAAPVQLYVIEVSTDVYPGELKVIESDNVFDEKLTLRHSADFGGEPEKFVMEWYYRPDEAGVSPPLPAGNDTTGWLFLGRGVGMSEFTIEGADVRTLSDNWVVMRYYYRDVFPTPPAVANTIPLAEDDPDNWSTWAGAPGNTQAMLAEGWLKRVVDKLNPLDARVRDFQRNETNTLVSMISQAGAYCGNSIALNDSAENLNSVGLIAAYQTLLKRGASLSIDSGQDYGPANVALLNMATRVSDLSMLLANEAYADAIDPTIGFTTASGELGSLAPATFAFQNQLDSSLEEELILLRGRDDTASTTRGCPIFNRLFWNFTNGDGEVAYVQTYNVLDQDVSGVIDEADAQEMFPQGHGDAWGHYLSAMQPWYRLMANDNFTWQPRAESILVAGVPVLIDYLDERKFALAAAAKAKAGVEIIDLTYRSSFVDDADGQWQGYKDSDEDRAWGVDEWSRRVGNGAYLDWVLANAMLPPEDLNPEHTGIRKIDRTTVSEIHAIASHYHTAQNKIDMANAGLNPLGLARGVVPFDIDPSFLDVSSATQGLTHFEQIYQRALKAMQNTTLVFDFANEFTQSLRRSNDSLSEFKTNLIEQETDYKNRLIEIFGYPYSDDIGAGGTYPSGYDGPDWAHFMIVERSELTGETPSPIDKFDVTYDFSSTDLDPDFGITATTMTVEYPVASDGPWLVKDPTWTGSRRATGEIQDALSDYMQAEAGFRRSLKEFEATVGGINRIKQSLERRYHISAANIYSVRTGNEDVSNLEAELRTMNGFLLGARRATDISDRIFENIIGGFPTVAGTSFDVAGPIRAGVGVAKIAVASTLSIGGDILEESILAQEHAINVINRDGDYELYVNDARYEVAQKVSELGPQLNKAIVKQYVTFQQKEAMNQALGRFNAAVAKGERLLSERGLQRKLAAADVQDYRYNDISFRIFRNDSLQKYRAQFDLAARYVYLAAMAYDYETNLLGSSTGSGAQFISEIFRERSLGKMVDGKPVAGLGGLADVLARLGQNFDLYKTRLGFNNPQTETNRFSLRKGHFRIRGDASSDAVWKTELASHLVPNLWDEEDFKRYALPFTTEDLGDQPALVIPFSTTVTFGKNFFGWPLSGGDSAYDPTNFATKVRSVGVWFEGYPLDQLSQTPRVYLVPIGADVLRAPGDDSFSTRQWNIVDQKLPVPFALGASDLAEPTWIPMNDSLSDDIGGIRRYPSLRAYKYSDVFDDGETTTNSRLIGRSVWNTQWLLIIPGGTLLFDPDSGLDTFLNEVTDIKLFFQTYSYTGE